MRIKPESYFVYSEAEIDYLSKKDKKFALAIERIGRIERPVMPDLFQSLINSIVGQQISTKAQITVWNRIVDSLGEVTPQTLLIDVEIIQSFGMTTRKAGYIKNIAEKVHNGDLDLQKLYTLSDKEVVEALSSLSGIGVWTAEMILLFSMERPDIFSYGDLAIHRGMRMLYHHRKIDKDRFEKYRRRYSPYGSVASLYLWELASGRWEDYPDTL